MKPTEQQLQEIYEESVSAECAEKQGEEMSSFDLLCKLDEVGGLATFIRSMIEQERAANSDREMLKRLAVILSGSDAPGEIRSLTVTAQSFVDRCKTLAKERDAIIAGQGLKTVGIIRHVDMGNGKTGLHASLYGHLPEGTEILALNP